MVIRKCDFPLQVDDQGRELEAHGTAPFPISCYEEDLSREAVIWHWHEDWEIILAVEGTVVVSSYGEQYRLAAGQGLFLNAGIPHALRGEGSGPAVIHSAVFHPRLLGSSDSIFWQRYIRPVMENRNCRCVLLDGSQPWHRAMMDAAEQAWQAADEEAVCYEFAVRESLSTVAQLLYRHYPAGGRAVPGRERRELERIKIMLAFIREHYGEKLTLERIAESAAVSESECLRCFRKTIGTTPIRYLTQFRVQRGADLLLSTDRKIVDIALDCGFGDASYFIRQFRLLKGVTPSEYREQQNDA